jgi:Holliday junction DNA helicase RuvA
MIAHLDGTVSAVAPDCAVIDVGGVGLLVQCTPGTLAGLHPGERARVATALVVREDALTLYGFATQDERNTFELLQTASGIGPRLALAMLAVFSPDQLRRAVAAADVAALTSVPGIGRKGAQRIVLELAGRLGAGDGSAAAAGTAGAVSGNGAGPAAGAGSWQDQVRAGLVSLGWPAREADQAIAAVEAGSWPDGVAGPGGDDADGGRAGQPAEVDVAQALRAALRVLGQR